MIRAVLLGACRISKNAAGLPGRSERWEVWGAISGPTMLLIVALGLAMAGPAAAQRDPSPIRRPPPHPEPPAALSTAARNELECRNCHESKHQGVVQMYLGLGGRGTPMIPSHMFQVRVQCVACHTAPKEEAATAAITGRTFRPTEEACLGCHGEKYRGMLARWVETLGKMRGIVEPKLSAARLALRAADPKAPKPGRARALLDDADFNLRFVVLAKGVHNVFYAADLLKLSNTWVDEALATLGKPAVKSDDALVRGGYCAVLCHEQAGVKLPATVSFGTQKIPHARHVAEFGAVCTACHSAEVHKAVTAKPATCTACHHSPANERCESCHRVQSTFYRGTAKTSLAKVGTNVMVNAVGCTGCHDMARKHSRQAVGEKCVSCHDAAYMSFLTEWTTGTDQEIAKAAAAVRRAEALARGSRATAEVQALVKEAREALALVRKARPVHNPEAASALLEAARQKVEAIDRRK